MAFEGLKDRAVELWAELSAKVQESSAFNTAREKFESQPPTVQRALLLGGSAFVIFCVLYIPLSYFSTSMDNMGQFEENRRLIQGLLRASRSAKETSPLPPPMDATSLRATVERVVREKKLLPEQVSDMQEIPGEAFKGVPPGVVQVGIAAQLRHLNLQQIMDIGNSFQNLGPGTKLIGLDITQTAGQDHYYDFKVRVASFGIPAIAAVDTGADHGKRPPPKKKAAAEDEE